MTELLYNYFHSPLGDIELASNSNNMLVACRFFEINGKSLKKHSANSSGVFTETKKQLTAYFNSGLQKFDLPLQLHGTDFQKKFGQNY